MLATCGLPLLRAQHSLRRLTPGGAGSVWNPAPLDLPQQRSGRQGTTEQLLHQ